MDRRQFCKSSLLAAAWTLSPRPAWAEPDLIQAASDALRKAGTNAALASLAGQERVMDPYRHYPSKPGIKDPKTGHSFFFHAHRSEEFGHFHTAQIPVGEKPYRRRGYGQSVSHHPTALESLWPA